MTACFFVLFFAHLAQLCPQHMSADGHICLKVSPPPKDSEDLCNLGTWDILIPYRRKSLNLRGKKSLLGDTEVIRSKVTQSPQSSSPINRALQLCVFLCCLCMVRTFSTSAIRTGLTDAERPSEEIRDADFTHFRWKYVPWFLPRSD